MRLRVFRDRRSAVAAGLTLALLSAMELSDNARPGAASDSVQDQGTIQEFGAAMSVAVSVSVIALLRGRPIPRRPRRWWAGLGLIWSGAIVNRAAKRKLGKNHRAMLTVVDAHDVTTEGPYKVVRHPMYAGASLICVGAGLAIDSLPSFAAWTLPIAALVRRIRVEEAMLRDALGDRYDDYARGRARLVPLLW